MKTVLTAILLISFQSFIPGKKYDYRTETDVIRLADYPDRDIYIYYPASAQTGQPVPVVFMFHGTGGDGREFYNASTWKELARPRGFIAVFPTAERYHLCEDGEDPKWKTKWAVPELEEILCPGQDLGDDIAFFRQLLNQLSSTYPIDPERVFITGFSNGGAFTSYLLLQASDVVSAAASHAGGLDVDLSQETFKNKRPVFLSVGTLDPYYTPYNGGEELPFGSALIDAGWFQHRLPGNLSYYCLAPEYEELRRPTVGTSRSALFGALFDQPGLCGDFRRTAIVTMLFDNLGHHYPNGRNYRVSLPLILYEFFMRYTD